MNMRKILPLLLIGPYLGCKTPDDSKDTGTSTADTIAEIKPAPIEPPVSEDSNIVVYSMDTIYTTKIVDAPPMAPGLHAKITIADRYAFERLSPQDRWLNTVSIEIEALRGSRQVFKAKFKGEEYGALDSCRIRAVASDGSFWIIDFEKKYPGPDLKGYRRTICLDAAGREIDNIVPRYNHFFATLNFKWTVRPISTMEGCWT